MGFLRLRKGFTLASRYQPLLCALLGCFSSSFRFGHHPHPGGLSLLSPPKPPTSLHPSTTPSHRHRHTNPTQDLPTLLITDAQTQGRHHTALSTTQTSQSCICFLSCLPILFPSIPSTPPHCGPNMSYLTVLPTGFLDSRLPGHSPQ